MLLDIGLQAPPPPGPLPKETEGPDVWPAQSDGRPSGSITDESNDSFMLAGKGFTADFATCSTLAEVDAVEERRFVAGGWQGGRTIYGDERLSIRYLLTGSPWSACGYYR